MSRSLSSIRIRVRVKDDHKDPFVARCMGFTASTTGNKEWAAQRAAAKAFNWLLSAVLTCELSENDIELTEIKPSGAMYMWDARIKEDK
jgi:hypothetical protein